MGYRPGNGSTTRNGYISISVGLQDHSRTAQDRTIDFSDTTRYWISPPTSSPSSTISTVGRHIIRIQKTAIVIGRRSTRYGRESTAVRVQRSIAQIPI